MSSTSTATSNQTATGSNTSQSNTSGTNLASTSGTNTATQGTTSNVNPWAAQAPYLSQAFSAAGAALPGAMATPAPTQFTAQYTPAQINSFLQQLGYGSNTSVPASSAAAGGALSSIGAAGTGAGIAGLEGYNPASTNNMSNIVSGANQYAQGLNIPAQVQAAMQNANIEANYVTNPGIDAQAAADGSISGSRDAIQHGLVATNLANTAANTSAELQANAYNTGAGLTSNTLQSNNTNALSSLLGLTQGGTGAANAGTGANTGSVGQAGGLFDIANAGSGGITAANQAPLTNIQQQFAAGTSDPFAALQNYLGIIGGNYGSSSTGTQTSTGATTNTGTGTDTSATTGSGTMTGTQNGTQTSTPSTMSIISSLLGGGGALLGSNPGANGAGGSGLLGSGILSGLGKMLGM